MLPEFRGEHRGSHQFAATEPSGNPGNPSALKTLEPLIPVIETPIVLNESTPESSVVEEIVADKTHSIPLTDVEKAQQEAAQSMEVLKEKLAILERNKQKEQQKIDFAKQDIADAERDISQAEEKLQEIEGYITIATHALDFLSREPVAAYVINIAAQVRNQQTESEQVASAETTPESKPEPKLPIGFVYSGMKFSPTSPQS